MKPLVRLYDAGLGLVFPWPSGVKYANQACGHACMQPEVEGVFVPFEAEESWSRLSEYFEGAKYLGSGAMRGLDAEDAARVDAGGDPSAAEPRVAADGAARRR